MNIEDPNFNIEQAPEKTAEQVLEGLIEKTPEDFLREVIDSMQRFKDKKTFIVREALHALPKGDAVDEGQIKVIMDALPDWVEIYLKNN